MYASGTTLRINMGAFFHYGLADGLGNVIHNSKRKMKVVVETYSEFSGGKEIEISEISSENPSSSVNIARRYIDMPYNLFKANCEQFVRMCHGLEGESTQVQQYILAAFGAGIAIKGNNDIIKAAGGAVALASLLTPSEESPFQNAIIAGVIVAGIVALSR